jgi:sugar/nucleoside kinase (ribokinase family)
MPLLVVGTVALDTVETPTAKRTEQLGGSAVYFSYAASYFTAVRLAGVVGEDWPGEYTELLRQRRIDVSGLQIVPGTKTFRWHGRYASNMSDRETIDVQLNVYGEHRPPLSEECRRSPFVFLATGSPHQQLEILDEMTGPRLVVADTTDLWIRDERDALLALLRRVSGLMLNDTESRLLTSCENVVQAGLRILELGPTFVVIKRGEHGAVFFSKHETYVLPAFPTPDVVDPTGAGDSFAGGMMGYLAEQGNFEPKTLKEAMAYGILLASFTVEDHGLDRVGTIDRSAIELRMDRYRKMLSF